MKIVPLIFFALGAMVYLGFSSSASAGEFSQDFSNISSLADLLGAGDGQFDFVDRAGKAVELSVSESAFQADVAYDPEDSELQNSGARLTRLTAIHPDANLLVVRFTFEARLKSWPPVRQGILNLMVGEKFRATPFNPARDNVTTEGPAFASIGLSAARGSGQFMLYTGKKENSAEFSSETNSADGHVFPMVFAFNSGSKEITFDSPSGNVPLSPGTFSAWVGNTLVWSDVPAMNPQAKPDNFSFGLGRGTDTTAADGQSSEGVFRLSNIKVSASNK